MNSLVQTFSYCIYSETLLKDKRHVRIFFLLSSEPWKLRSFQIHIKANEKHKYMAFKNETKELVLHI